MMRLVLFLAVIMSAQVISWYQTNTLLINEWVKNNLVLFAIVLSPIVGVLFTYSTKLGFEVLGTLWAVRFTAFALGYLVFVFLSWYHLGEDPFTLKNIVTSALCFAILAVQMFWR